MLRIYACGGTGTNIVTQIPNINIEPCYIDTSKSNLAEVDENLTFLTPDMDGGGKNRALVYEKFQHHVEDILVRFKPSDQLNVVISSLSGGSGSIIGPLVTKELVSKGYNVIVIGVESQHSIKEVDNTIKALMTYQSFSNICKKPISLYYVKNASRSEADQQAIRFINLLTLLVSKEHTAEFDTADLMNFINFTNVTDNTPTVSVIEVSLNEVIIPEKGTSIVSTILFSNNPTETLSTNPNMAPTKPEYLATCLVTDPEYKITGGRMDNFIGKLPLIVSELEKSVKEHNDNTQLNKIADLKVHDTSHGGVVL